MGYAHNEDLSKFLAGEKNLTREQRHNIYGMICAAWQAGFDYGLEMAPSFERVRQAGAAFARKRDEAIMKIIEESS